MTRPTIDETLLEIAVVMAKRGTCSRARVGAVAAFNGRILSSGHNGAPSGIQHCIHPPDELSKDSPERAPTCTLAVHAEANVIAFASRYGIALEDATLYTTLTPCVPCSQLIINAGFMRVVALDPYRNLEGVRLLESTGVVVDIVNSPRVESRTQ